MQGTLDRDLDEPRGRWRVRPEANHAGKPRWVQSPPDLLERVVALVPREDRNPAAPVFPWFRQERARTEIARACKATGTPLWSPHDLRHRRLSLWSHAGVPIREVAHRGGHSRPSLTLDVYTHVLVDDREVDRAAILA